MASAEHVAQAFWLALCRHDLQRAGSLLADDAVFYLAGMAPLVGAQALHAPVLAIDDELCAHLKTVALYDDMLIAERVGPVASEPPERLQAIVSLIRVQGDRITSWQDFFDPRVSAAVIDPPEADLHLA